MGFLPDSFTKWTTCMNVAGAGFSLGAFVMAIAYHSLLGVGPAPSPASPILLVGIISLLTAVWNWRHMTYSDKPKEPAIVGRIP